MRKILITGATGNIGKEVIHYLQEFTDSVEVIAAVRDLENDKLALADYPNLTFRMLDFEDSATFNTVFAGVNILFLLRPPQISEVEKYFRPLLKSAQENGIQNIAFLSVQGAEKSKVIPHNKIERMLKSMGFNYIFIRPSYFMQNLTTTLLPELLANQTITLPSGTAKFVWVDVKNIGEATAKLLVEFENYQKNAYEITGTEKMNFSTVADLLSEITGVGFKYRSINPISFYLKKIREGVQSGFALVMTILHFLSRLQKTPGISNNYQKLTSKTPTTLGEFILREKEKIVPPK